MTLLEWLQMIGLFEGVYILEPVHNTVVIVQRAAILLAKNFGSVHFKYPSYEHHPPLKRQALPPFKSTNSTPLPLKQLPYRDFFFSIFRSFHWKIGNSNKY